MSRALIGHSGFVGGSLRRQAGFERCFNSANFRHMADAGRLRLAQFRSTLDCLELAGARHDDTLIFIGDDALAAKFGALADRPAAMAPRNWHRLDAGQVAIFLERFQIRFAYLADRELKTGPAGAARLVPIPGCTAPVVRIQVS